MTDQCKNCTVRGDINACKATDCFHHENWYAVEQQKEIDELKAHCARLQKAASCPCGDVGYIVRYNTYNGDPEQEQCEFCYTEPNSRYTVIHETPAQSLAEIQARSIDKAKQAIFKTFPLEEHFSLREFGNVLDSFADALREGSDL